MIGIGMKKYPISLTCLIDYWFLDHIGFNDAKYSSVDR